MSGENDMRLVIETYWNKIKRDPSAPFGSNVLPEFELKNRSVCQKSGWGSVSEWKRYIRKMVGFMGFDNEGAAVVMHYPLSNYGILSFQLVWVD